MLTHLDELGRISMVDVTEKNTTVRRATARSTVKLSPAAFRELQEEGLKKGELIPVVKLAAIMGAKKTWELIPLAHPLNLTHVDVKVEAGENEINITVSSSCAHGTGVEMEAMTGAAVGGLAVYDMIKAIDKSAVVTDVKLITKSGGKSGDFIR
jgi:cyclic pyranopterin phosphate synthase